MVSDCSVRICITPAERYDYLDRSQHLAKARPPSRPREWTRVGSQPNQTARVADLRYHTQVPGTILAPTASAPQAASPAMALRHCAVCQDLSTRNILSEIGTPHRAAAETRLILFLILCQTYCPKVGLQYASSNACRTSHWHHPRARPVQRSLFSVPGGPEPSLSTLCCNGQIMLRTTSLVRHLLRKNATFAKTCGRDPLDCARVSSLCERMVPQIAALSLIACGPPPSNESLVPFQISAIRATTPLSAIAHGTAIGQQCTIDHVSSNLAPIS